MTIPTPNARRAGLVLVALAVPVLGACGSDAGNAQSRSSGAGSAGACLSAGEVAKTVGFEVRFMERESRSMGSLAVCAYEATGDQSGTFVSIVSGPASDTAEAMEEVRSGAKAMLGTAAEAEAIDVGEGGLAYGSSGKSEAAAVARGRLYRVDVTSAGLGGPGDKKDAAVELLRLAIR